MKLSIRTLIYPLLMLMFVLTTSSSFRNDVSKNDQSVSNAALGTGTVKDRDGNVYKTVRIGTQVWMAENLRTTKYRNGDPIPQVIANTSWSVLNSGAYCWYNNDDKASKITYGALYNWFAIDDKRNIAPIGWHIPTDKEWAVLVTFLKGDQYAGDALKETQTSHWSDPNSAATNSSGFSALPGGYRNKDGIFKNINVCGGWWADTEYTKSLGWYRYVDNVSSSIHNVSTYKNCGFSIRCIKD
jgi:uncharacterized protein (TIGR02145 family)